ncbi:MAG: ATP-binding protein [Pirellulaceae bacterium]|nr:ATP-binding protein [Pirellulaceae bacterium]
MREIVERAWQSLTSIPEAKIAALKCDLDDIEVFVDPLRLEQVFRNLFENAIAVSPSPAEIQVSSTLEHFAERRMIRIFVRDNGPGFSSEQREKAFEPFYPTRRKGTGLGLPICNRIVGQHQGWLEIAPNSEFGGCMVMVLPQSTGSKLVKKSSEKC